MICDNCKFWVKNDENLQFVEEIKTKQGFCVCIDLFVADCIGHKCRYFEGVNMEITNYQKMAHSFASIKDGEIDGLIYAVLGLNEEINEYIHSERNQKIKEAGDVLWMISEICSRLGLNYEFYLSKAKEKSNTVDFNYFSIYYVLRKANEISGHTAKMIRDKNKVVDGDYQDKIHNCILAMMEELCVIFEKETDEKIENIQKINIEKLTDRKKRNVIHGSGDNR